jgi:hypothetical protein
MNFREMVIELPWGIDKVEQPPTKNHTFICLACLCWEGCIRWTTSRMCLRHAQEFIQYRKRRGEPPLKQWKKRIIGKGKRTQKAILAALASGPATTRELARMIGKTSNGTRYSLQVLEREEKVKRVDDSFRHVWGLTT